MIDSLEKDAGVWFGLGSDGTTMTTANDLYGSFVYGTYTITELRTESTKNMREMYKDTFSITEEAKTLDLETISNVPMGITTTLVTVEGSHYASATNSVKLIDHVSYKNLDTTKTYTLTGYLYKKDKTTVSTFKKETITFQPKEENGTVDVTFTFDASELKGKAIFAVEQLTLDGKFCAEHADSKDLNQAVFFPDVQTTALDNTTNAHVSAANDSITITDTITYSGLCAGETYRVVGTLIDKATGKAIEVGGNKVTAEATFVPEKTTGNTYVDYEASGTVDITFTFNASALEGTVLVAYEKIYKGTEVVASHEDSTDENQTVYLPKISTSAKDKATGLNQIQAKEATLVDTVSYSSLPSLEYTLTGVLMNAATGEELKINGKSVTASTTFTPDKTSGSVDVTFNFDASSLAGTTIVVYETLTYKGKTIATHKDLKDSNQTVYVPGLQTTAVGADTNDHFTMASKKITLVDTVTYSNLEVGREYTVKGVLMDKATNASVKVGGKKSPQRQPLPRPQQMERLIRPLPLMVLDLKITPLLYLKPYMQLEISLLLMLILAMMDRLFMYQRSAPLPRIRQLD